MPPHTATLRRELFKMTFMYLFKCKCLVGTFFRLFAFAAKIRGRKHQDHGRGRLGSSSVTPLLSHFSLTQFQKKFLIYFLYFPRCLRLCWFCGLQSVSYKDLAFLEFKKIVCNLSFSIYTYWLQEKNNNNKKAHLFEWESHHSVTFYPNKCSRICIKHWEQTKNKCVI